MTEFEQTITTAEKELRSTSKEKPASVLRGNSEGRTTGLHGRRMTQATVNQEALKIERDFFLKHLQTIRKAA